MTAIRGKRRNPDAFRERRTENVFSPAEFESACKSTEKRLWRLSIAAISSGLK
jgi:hypothetical protein